jgi:8-oxo-dGTP diphosphatase
MKPTDVVCALIVDRDKILIVQYGPDSKYPGKWEFPGGKVHEGELPEEALVREIREELGAGLNILFPLESVDFSYPDKMIRLIPFVCRMADKVPVMVEHSDYRWVVPLELDQYDLLPADRDLLKTGANYPELVKLLSSGKEQHE